MNDSLSRRIARAMWLLSSLICVVSIVLSAVLILQNSDKRAKERIEAAQANLLALGVIDLIALNEFQDIVVRLPQTAQADRTSEMIRIYDTRGALLYTNTYVSDISNAPLDRSKYVDKGFYIINGKSLEYLALIRSYQTIDRHKLWIEIATPRQTIASILKGVAAPFVSFLIFILVLSFFLARWVTHRALRPLDSVSMAIDQLEVDRFTSWEPIVDTNQLREFKPILGKINHLLVRVQSSFLKFHRLAQFVSHEIRTPLTVIRGEIETTLMRSTASTVDLKGVLESALEEVSKIDEIVNSILRLLATDRDARPLQLEPVNVSELLREILPKVERWSRRGVELKEKPNAPLVIVDRDLLSLLISNLVRNIATHTPTNVKATIVTDNSSGNFIIQIIDQGPGLSTDLLHAANEDRIVNEQLGIGLSLCKQIASVCRLGLQFENMASGGLKVTIQLPIVS